MTWGELLRWLRSPKATVGVVAALLAAFALGGAIAKDGLFGQVTAAWVQAIGSVAAITAAIWIAGRQFRQSEFHRWETDAARISVAVHLSQQALDAISQAQRSVMPRIPTFEPSNFETVQAALQEVPLLDLPAGRAAITVVNLRRSIQLYASAYDLWLTTLAESQRVASRPYTNAVDEESLAAQLAKIEGELARIYEGVGVLHEELVNVDMVMKAIRPS